MDYMTALASSPVYEFPYSGHQEPSIPVLNNDIDAILASIAPPLGGTVYNQPPTLTLHCVPQISPSIGNNATVYQVPENMSLEAILQQFGIDASTLQRSGTLNNYYRTTSQPMETIIHSPYRRRRRLICQEVSDSEDDLSYRPPPPRRRRHSDSWSNRPQQPPPAIHNLLGRVWDRSERATRNFPPSNSSPNLNTQWQPPSPPPMSQVQQNAVNNVWNRAQTAGQQNTNFVSNIFNKMRQPTGNIIQPPPPNREAVGNFFAARNVPYGLNRPPSPQNREAVGNFFAARNLPPGINQPPPLQNREAVGNFFASRNLPYGLNQPPPLQNQEAVGNFFAARNLPPGINRPPPPQNQEAVGNFFAARNLPYGINRTPPPQNQEAVGNFFAARNLPYGINQPPPPQNREAVGNFIASRNLPFGINQPPPQQNREALQDFFAARNLPYGINPSPSPPPNREAVQDFYAARNLPYGINLPQPPPQNREAVQDFFAARNLPYGINQPNQAVANVWNRADNAAYNAPSPMFNTSWNQMRSPSPTPLSSSWYRGQQNPANILAPFAGPIQPPNRVPAPLSFGGILAQAHSQHLPYAGAV